MSTEMKAIAQAQEKLELLLEAARSGAIIPIRLPGQIEEIVELVKQADEEARKAVQEAQQAASGPADMQEYMKEEAYFVGHAVHELRTPMTSIRGYGDMLVSMGGLNDMQKQFMDVIQTNTRRLESLMSDVSYANKLRKGTLRATLKMDMFKNIAMRVEKDMKPVAEQLQRQLEFDIPQGLPLLNTDGDLLTIALDKLVENGLRYSAEGEGKVTVHGEADGNTLVIRVQDNGIGMSADDLGKLGTIYFRSEHDAVRAHKGSGLGIPIAYGIVKLLGASIAVESQVDQGTTFTIRLEGMS